MGGKNGRTEGGKKGKEMKKWKEEGRNHEEIRRKRKGEEKRDERKGGIRVEKGGENGGKRE